MASSKKKKAVESSPAKKEMISLYKTTYHRYRHWLRTTLIEGKVNKFSFKKDKAAYTGVLLVEKSEVEKAKKVLSEYKAKNPDTIDMWW
jgi:hypothetical protein